MFSSFVPILFSNAANFLFDTFSMPSTGARTSAGLKRIKAFGFELINMFSFLLSNFGKVAQAAAKCPPAEPPPAAILLASIPNLEAFSRTQRIADLASETHSLTGTPCLFLTR